MSCKLRSMILALVVLASGTAAMTASVAHADVFNMGGTRNPTTGIWTGQASLDFVTVGNPGNAADPFTGSQYGSVPYTYQMGKYDVTVGQYTAFLNAVAKTDTYGLYNINKMPIGATSGYYPTIGITQSGSSGSYSYSVTGSYSQAANCPAFAVSWGDAARFCNWLQNGQLTSGVENASTTENGAYTLNGAITNEALMSVNRNAGAKYFIPSENEWYKAAYYDPNKAGGAGYWRYPTKSDGMPINTLSSTGTNNANFDISFMGGFTDPTNILTPVGAFAASPGPYDTFDMGGDINQWNEAVASSTSRRLRGGGWYTYPSSVEADERDGMNGAGNCNYLVGFRVASVPEPGSLVMLAVIALGGLLCWWRTRA
jgi:formylglycine-generating enzyme required for sulfatase activity